MIAHRITPEELVAFCTAASAGYASASWSRNQTGSDTCRELTPLRKCRACHAQRASAKAGREVTRVGVLTSGAIKERAREPGFDLCGTAPAADFPELEIPAGVARPRRAEMEHMSKSVERRADIRNVLPSAKSVIVTGTLYNTQTSATCNGCNGCARRCRSACARAGLSRGARRTAGGAARMDARSTGGRLRCRDLRRQASRSGTRLRGMHAVWLDRQEHLSHQPRAGFALFLAGIATNLALEHDAPGFDRLSAARTLHRRLSRPVPSSMLASDATKCISYLTIEVHGAIPEAQRPQIGNHAYGCDICQDVAWNLAAPTTSDPAWRRSSAMACRPRISGSAAISTCIR